MWMSILEGEEVEGTKDTCVLSTTCLILRSRVVDTPAANSLCCPRVSSPPLLFCTCVFVCLCVCVCVSLLGHLSLPLSSTLTSMFSAIYRAGVFCLFHGRWSVTSTVQNTLLRCMVPVCCVPCVHAFAVRARASPALRVGIPSQR